VATISNLRRESLAGGRVKGAMVRAHLQFVRDRLGEPALARTLEALPAAVAAEVQGILASTWCAFESVVVLDRTIARALTGGFDDARRGAAMSLTVDARDIAAENDYPSLRLPDIATVALPLRRWLLRSASWRS
jgi:hypothetical protein